MTLTTDAFTATLPADGPESWESIVADESDSRRAALNLMEDAVEARRAMEKLNGDLRESERRFREMIDALPAAIYTTDAAGRLTHFNPACVELAGRTPELGSDQWCVSMKLYRPDGTPLPHDQCPMAVALKENRTVRGGEAIAARPDGSRVHFAAYPTPLRDAAGRLIGGINMLVDVTERRLAERKLEEQAAALAEADHHKDEFLAMLSHELRNPLTPIFNALQILDLDSEGPAEKRESRAVISRQVRQLAHLVDDLLEVSRFNTGRMRLQKKRIEFCDFVGSTVEAIRYRTEEKNQELLLTLRADRLWLNADPTRLGQIVENLLTNACKYTESGGHIGVMVEAKDDEAVLRVRDDGVGISAELLPHLFDLFSQGEVSLARSEGGLGIGLSLVKRLVAAHGGTVEVESNGCERGSEFVVRLPLAGEAEVIDEEEDCGPDDDQPTAPLRILVVDDNVDAAKMTAILLSASGHELRMVHSGPAALDVSREFHPQVVLLDIGLPGMDGYEVARRFRKNPQFQGVTLVALTGYGQESDRQQAIRAGFDHHLTKPVEFAELKKLLAGRPVET